MQIKLRVREEDLMARTVALSERVLTIGRSADSTIRLAHQAISRHHARIQFDPQSGYVLSDSGSKAGTLLNDRPLTQAMILRQGDEIGVGQARLIVLEIDDRDGHVALPADEAATAVDETVSPDGAATPAVMILPSQGVEPARTRVALSHGMGAKSDYEQAVEAVRADFERFWKGVKARTPFSLAAEMQSLRDAVDAGILRLGRVVESVRESNDRLQKLLEASRVISAPLPLRERLETILDLAIEKLEADRGFLMLYSQRRRSLRLALQRGMSDLGQEMEIPDEASASERPGVQLAQETLKSGTTQFRLAGAGRGAEVDFAAFAAQGIHGAICAPMKVKSRFLGLIYVEFREGHRLAQPLVPEDADWLDSLASMAALAIENARLIERQKAEG